MEWDWVQDQRCIDLYHASATSPFENQEVCPKDEKQEYKTFYTMVEKIDNEGSEKEAQLTERICS